jgi:uncharacterized DUF497 family protein
MKNCGCDGCGNLIECKGHKEMVENNNRSGRDVAGTDDSFEWDENKNIANARKHGISFEEAMTVFDDDNALYKPDPDHSYDEDRFIILGLSANLRLLVVCHCHRGSDAVIRIISARKATKSERAQYGGAR